jgi:hypothetical protein
VQSRFGHLSDVRRTRPAKHWTSPVVPQSGTGVRVLVGSRYVGFESLLPSLVQLHSVSKREVGTLGDFREEEVVRLGKDLPAQLRRRRTRHRGCQFEDLECENPVEVSATV